MLFHFCRHTYNKVANIIKIITKYKLLPISIFHNFNVCFQLHLELFASLDKVIYIVKKVVFSSLWKCHLSSFSINFICLQKLFLLYNCKGCKRHFLQYQQNLVNSQSCRRTIAHGTAVLAVLCSVLIFPSFTSWCLILINFIQAKRSWIKICLDR